MNSIKSPPPPAAIAEKRDYTCNDDNTADRTADNRWDIGYVTWTAYKEWIG